MVLTARGAPLHVVNGGNEARAAVVCVLPVQVNDRKVVARRRCRAVFTKKNLVAFFQTLDQTSFDRFVYSIAYLAPPDSRAQNLVHAFRAGVHATNSSKWVYFLEGLVTVAIVYALLNAFFNNNIAACSRARFVFLRVSNIAFLNTDSILQQVFLLALGAALVATVVQLHDHAFSVCARRATLVDLCAVHALVELFVVERTWTAIHAVFRTRAVE